MFETSMASDTKQMDFCSESTISPQQKRFASELEFETESAKKLKCQDIQPSPDLFDDDDGVLIPQENDEQKDDDNACANDDDAQCDDNDAMQCNNLPLENRLVPNVWATPPNEFITQSHSHSQTMRFTELIAGLGSESQSQRRSQTPQIEQQRLPSMQEQEPEPEPEPTLQQQQPASEVPPNPNKHRSVDDLIEELTLSSERVFGLIDDIKKQS